MKKLTLLIFIFSWFIFPAFASDDLKLLEFKKHEFSPAQGSIFEIPFEMTHEAKVSITIFSPDGDFVREIKSSKPLKSGVHKLVWDGKDSKGQIVADEAYLPVISAIDDTGREYQLDPRKTGGEVIENLIINITPDKNISFKLPFPARVLSRAGIKGGAMLRTITNWEPKNKGKVTIHWDGFDQDKLRDIRNNKQLSVLVRAYRLPDFSIITSGNHTFRYREYRKTIQKSDWKPIAKKDFILERNNQRIDRHYYMPKSMSLSPTVLGEFLNKYPKDEQDRLKIKCPCSIKVNLTDDEKPQLQKSLYEIAFFVDDQFVSEQEQGYVPFTWRWSPSNLTKGEHMLTINVSGLRGEVGVKSMILYVE